MDTHSQQLVWAVPKLAGYRENRLQMLPAKALRVMLLNSKRTKLQMAQNNDILENFFGGEVNLRDCPNNKLFDGLYFYLDQPSSERHRPDGVVCAG